MPYNLVDKEGFKLFVNALNPSYRLPSRTTLSNRKIPDLFKETKMKVESILSKTIYLGCQDMSDNHTGENLADAIQLILLEYDREINVGIGAITTDNGANVLKATAIRELSIEQRRYGLPTVKFPTYSKTRWWSLLDLIEIAISQELALASFLRSYKNGIHKDKMYNEEEMIVLKTLIHVLQPIRQISDNLAGETFVTASAIIPVIKIEENKLTETATNDSEINIDQTLKKTVLQTIVDLLHVRYNNNYILKMCTVLDPRFKFDVISLETHDAETSAIKTLIKEECIEAWEYWIKTSNNTLIIDSEPRTKKQNVGLTAIFDTFNQTQSTDREISLSDGIDKEIDAYFQVPKIKSSSTWWFSNESMFPKLHIMARKYLCIQATSVPSERVFSRAGNIVTDHRASLSDEHCSQLIFLSMNKKFIDKPFS
ncbi:zinc finger BED domain-containing protein 1-like [Acyrthosiphon pisum]|uniref:HAT C-terminal dimerisation domain-containing protein n=1 Tax=Acyrthosiphon pisum TaxID=7029 RepID=A0A8R2FCB8_ACYPI|nr:zinc finger BED domain-containing protein 1-like [Acyrthosiphon pisum]|eukprot:XP_008188657.1 PREDICTED: zinc finger BED domain-containing protein 1-like [Acyrthosiphon pisum]